MSVELHFEHFEPKLSPYIVGTQWTGMVNTSTFVIFQSVFAEGVMASIFLFLHETCNFKPLIRAERSSGRSPERSEVSLKFFEFKIVV